MANTAAIEGLRQPYTPEANPTVVVDKLGTLLKRKQLTNRNMLEGIADAQATIFTLRDPQPGDDPEEVTAPLEDHPLYLGFSKTDSFRDPLLGFPDATCVVWAYPITSSNIDSSDGYGLQFRQQKNGRYAGIVTQYTFRQSRRVEDKTGVKLNQPLKHQLLEEAREAIIICMQQKAESALVPA